MTTTEIEQELKRLYRARQTPELVDVHESAACIQRTP